MLAISRCHTRGKSEESIARRHGSTQKRDPSWPWNAGRTSPEVQNRGISGLTKRFYVLQTLFQKTFLLKLKKQINWNSIWAQPINSVKFLVKKIDDHWGNNVRHLFPSILTNRRNKALVLWSFLVGNKWVIYHVLTAGCADVSSVCSITVSDYWEPDEWARERHYPRCEGQSVIKLIIHEVRLLTEPSIASETYDKLRGKCTAATLWTTHDFRGLYIVGYFIIKYPIEFFRNCTVVQIWQWRLT